jgi:hypothetical protein
MKATNQVGPTFWPECQYRHDKNKKNQRHCHLHNAKLRGVFCHKPAHHKSRNDQKPSGNPTEHDPSSSISTLNNCHRRTRRDDLDLGALLQVRLRSCRPETQDSEYKEQASDQRDLAASNISPTALLSRCILATSRAVASGLAT